jgi:hypothetical protein
MPISIKTTAGGTAYASPFVGAPRDVLHVKVDVSTLTSAEVDSKGYIKPGVPLTIAGALIGSSNTARVGIVVEATKVAEAGATLSGVTLDPFVAVAFGGTVNRDIIEDNLGRAVSANEIAGLNGIASGIVLSLT